MKILLMLILSVFLICDANTVTYADVINIPDDFESIQEAIDASEDGDTVLIQPGEYTETINFDGKAITVASLMLTTGNTAYIDSTIIDGDGDGSVVTFDSREDEESILMGLTIINGDAENGGGIYSRTSGPALLNLVVRDCESSLYGGGIYGYGSTMILRNVSLVNNRAGMMGGGFTCSTKKVN